MNRIFLLCFLSLIAIYHAPLHAVEMEKYDDSDFRSSIKDRFAKPQLITTLEPVVVEEEAVKPAEEIRQKFKFGQIKKDEVVKTDVISHDVIVKRSQISIIEAVANMPGVDKQQECSICGTTGITLQNLPSRFTTLMIDGVPLYSQFGSMYGLNMLNPAGVDNIEVRKGAGNSLIAPGAMGGTVNIISKKPIQTEGSLTVDMGSYNSQNATFYMGTPLKNLKNVSVAVFGAMSRMDHIDSDGDKVSESPAFERKNLGFNVFADNVGGLDWKLRFDTGSDLRYGGPVGKYPFAMMGESTGNPFDFTKTTIGSPNPNGWVDSNGNNVDYNEGRAHLLEVVDTRRTIASLVAEQNKGENRFKFALGYTNHTQDSFYSGTNYSANQQSMYQEMQTSHLFSSTNILTLGQNYRFENLRSHASFLPPSAQVGTVHNNLDKYDYGTLGFFTNYYLANANKTFETNTSLLLDRPFVKFGTDKSLGIQSMPRFNAKMTHSETFQSQIGLGRAYSLPTAFFETDHGILDFGKLKRDTNSPERAFNANYNLNITPSEQMRMNLGYNFTRISDMVGVGQEDADGDGAEDTIVFKNSDMNLITHGFELAGSYDLTPSFTLGAGAEKYIYEFDMPKGMRTPDVLVLSRPTEKFYLSADYNYDKFDIFSQLTVFGQQQLSKFYGTERYNLDGTRKAKTSPHYLMWNSKVDYSVTKNFTFYGGVNNMLNERQQNVDSYIFVDGAGSLDTTNIWGPNIGRLFFGGLKLTF
jgi:outer membrane receptor for ferrienterochelin and colicins